MADFQSYIDNAMQTLREGFANINHPKGLLIALVATLFMQSWRQWLPVALAAVIVHIVVDVLAPVLAGHGGQVTLPSNLMEAGFWANAGVLFVGYLIVIGIFFFLKKLVFRGGAKGD